MSNTLIRDYSWMVKEPMLDVDDLIFNADVHSLTDKLEND